MRDIYVYTDLSSWVNESPDATIRGTVKDKTPNYIEVIDENGYTQIINLNRVFAIVY